MTADVTRLLADWSQGNEQAFEQLAPVIYGELRQLAARYLRRERSNHTLQPTALVHEAYLRLIGQSNIEWQNRAHFFGVAAQMIRRILVDHARGRHAAKRGAGAAHFAIDDAFDTAEPRNLELIALDDALGALAALDPQQSRVIELRYFGGLSIEETAAVLNISPATVKREWAAARAWLYRELSGRS